VDIFTHLGIKDINEPIPPSKEESLRARLRLGNAEVNKLLKRFAPGCTRKTSTDILILADYLRRAIFPADVSVTIEHFYIICCCKSRLTLINCSQNLEGVPACRQNGRVLCDISLRSTYYHITLIPPQSGNGVTQETLKDDIRKQVDSVRNGGNHYFTDLRDDQLKKRLKRLGVKSKLPTKRPALVRKLWEKERDVSSTTVVGSGNDRNAPGVSVYSAVCFCLLLLTVSIYKHLNFFQSIYFPQELITDAPAAPAPSLIGSIGSDENANAELQAPGGFAQVENIIDANGRTSVSRHNDSSLSVIVNGAGVNSKTVNNITCGTNITVNYTSSLTESTVKELVEEQLRKQMASTSI
jgi:hypothetical protein